MRRYLSGGINRIDRRLPNRSVQLLYVMLSFCAGMFAGGFIHI